MQAAKSLRLVLFLLGVLTLFSFSAFAQADIQKDIVNIKPSVIQFEAFPGKEIKVKFNISVKATWHINSNKPNDDYLIASNLGLSNSPQNKNFIIKDVVYPKASEINLDFSDKPLSVYEGNFVVTGTMNVPANISPGKYPVEFSFKYQACNNSTCLPPSSVVSKIELNIEKRKDAEIQQIPAPKVSDNSDQTKNLNSAETTEPVTKKNTSINDQATGNTNSLLSKLESSGLFISLLVVFLGGLALNLTPCVYPLIPVTIGYFGGQSEGSTKKLFVLGLLYVLGMAITYSTIGVITALSGSVFGALLQNPYVLIGVALVLLALSLSMFGVYEFQLPVGIVNMVGGAKGGYFGAIFMGLTMGIVAAPCIGPFVLGLVTYVGVKADPFYGWVMFFFLALGLGFPYILLALFSGKIKNLPRAGFWMESVKHIFGFLLIGMALYFINPLFPKNISKYILPLFMIIAAFYLLLFDRMSNKLKGFRNFKIVLSVLVLGVAVYLLLPSDEAAPRWSHFSNEVYMEALTKNQPMIIDFYADWCIPCKELDAKTFSNSQVIDATKRFKNLKVDMTLALSEESGKIREKFNITGMPTVLIINSEGKEINRITGFINAEEFLNVVNKVD